MFKNWSFRAFVDSIETSPHQTAIVIGTAAFTALGATVVGVVVLKAVLSLISLVLGY